MKTLFTLFFCLQFVAGWSQAERKAASRIKDVTVFLSGAQVTRTSVLDVPIGVSVWVLANLSPKINEHSLQVEAPPGIKVLSVSFRLNHFQPAKKSGQLSDLEREKERLQSLLDTENALFGVYQEEISMLASNKQIGGQQGMNVEDLKTAVEFFRARMIDLKQKQQQITSRVTVYNTEIARVAAQLMELKNQKEESSGEVVVKLSSKSEQKSTLTISYVVQEAKWFPSYDVRAKDINSPIGITYKANVSQASGEDWDHVTLTISSGNPTSSGTRPMLDTWFLGFNNSYQDVISPSNTLAGRTSGLLIGPGQVRGRVISEEDGAPIPGVNVVVKGSSIGTVTDVNGEYSLATSNVETLVFSFIGMQTQEVRVGGRGYLNVALGADVKQLSEVVVTGLGTGTSSYFREPRVRKTMVATPVVRQTNVEYVIDEPYTIKSDGEVRTVEMIEYDIDALYHYYCAPKLDTDAFLVARLINWDEYNFLEGEASLFFEGKFLGKTVLDTRNTADTLHLSLGRDKNVFVTREKVKDFSSSQMLSNNRKSTFAYEIIVRNKKLYDVEIRIEDQIPVPNSREIMVDRIDDSNGLFNEETGLVVWNRKIAPGKTEKMQLKYAVKYPRWSHIILE